MDELWRLYKQNKQQSIKEKIVNNYLNLVNIIVGKIIIGMPKHISKDELISYGYFGLLDAIEKFDPDKGIKFETYASYRIRGSIFDELRSQDWVKPTIRKMEKKYVNTVAKIEQQSGQSASDEEGGSILY